MVFPFYFECLSWYIVILTILLMRKLHYWVFNYKGSIPQPCCTVFSVLQLYSNVGACLKTQGTNTHGGYIPHTRLKARLWLESQLGETHRTLREFLVQQQMECDDEIQPPTLLVAKGSHSQIPRAQYFMSLREEETKSCMIAGGSGTNLFWTCAVFIGWLPYFKIYCFLWTFDAFNCCFLQYVFEPFNRLSHV